MRHICLYIGVQIFIARAGAGSPEVVQEALADLKKHLRSRKYQTATQPALANALDLSHCAALLRSDPFNRKPASESLSLKSWQILKTEVNMEIPSNMMDGLPDCVITFSQAQASPFLQGSHG